MFLLSHRKYVYKTSIVIMKKIGFVFAIEMCVFKSLEPNKLV